MPQSIGPRPETKQAQDQLIRAFEKLLPVHISLENQTQEIEKRIKGFLNDVTGMSRTDMKKVTRLLEVLKRAIDESTKKSQISN
jgi:hypothetical protein